jgi:KDO2-lipid IV(A) lauroyltransferase
LGLLGFPPHSIARDLDNPYLHKFVHQFRGKTGQKIVPKKGGYEEIVRLLTAGRALAFLADQYAGSKGCWVTFFGRPASTHKAIALFALGHDARVIVSSAQRLDRPLRYAIRLHAVTDVRDGGPEVRGVRELTQWYTSAFESMIRQAPEQYWWLHRRWKDRRSSRQAARAAA